MSEKAVPQPEPTEEDVNTTPPNPQTVNDKSGWSMPKPVFRKTSGYLPQGFEKRFSQDELKTSQDDSDSTTEMAAPDLDAEIEPQPDISETPNVAFDSDQTAAAAAPARAKGSALKVVFVVLGLIFAAALAVVAVVAVYLFYLMPSSDSTFQ